MRGKKAKGKEEREKAEIAGGGENRQMVRGRETEGDEREVKRSDGGREEEVGRMIATKAVGGGQIRSKLLRHPTWANSLAGEISRTFLGTSIAWRHWFARNICTFMVFRDLILVHLECNVHIPSRTCTLDSIFHF